MNKIKEIIIEHVGFFISASVGLITICLILASPDIIGRKFFPEKHYSQLVKDLEKHIESLEYEIRNTQIDLQKEIVVTPLEASRFDDEKGRELMIELQKKKIELGQKQLGLLEKSLDEKQELLEKAKAELFKYKTRKTRRRSM